MLVQRRRRPVGWASCLSLIVLVLATPGFVEAQALTRAQVQQRSQKVSELFNWYYAAVYGTGVYTIGEETVGVIRLPMAYTIREATDTEWGLRLTFPVSAALVEFDLTDFDLGHTSAVGLSFLPGVEAEIPLHPGWVVKPFANVGDGWEFERDTSATIWSIGASTLYRRTLAPKWLLGLGLKLTYAGYSAGGTDSTLGAVSMGADLGLPIEMLGVSFDRIGLGYRQGSDGLKGVRLVASFPF